MSRSGSTRSCVFNGLPPTEDHSIADHLNGNSLVNCDDNFRWATRSENNKNLHGVAAQQLRLAIATGNAARVVGRAGRELVAA